MQAKILSAGKLSQNTLEAILLQRIFAFKLILHSYN